MSSAFLIQLYVIFYSLYYAKTGIFPFDWNYVDFSMFCYFAFYTGHEKRILLHFCNTGNNRVCGIACKNYGSYFSLCLYCSIF